MKVMKPIFKTKIVLLIAILFIFNSATELALAASSYDEMKKITISDFFDQTDDEYYVYFYRENCPYCNQVKDGIVKYSQIFSDLYIVDMSDKVNKLQSRYDWTALEEKYTRKIGHINQNGDICFQDGESKEKLENEYNKYGKKNKYEIVVIDQNNIDYYEGSQINDVFAVIQTPEIDYASVSTPDKLIVAGIPTLLHIENGHITDFYFDSPEIKEFLQDKGI